METSVLIVDDSATVRKVVRRVLKQAGFAIDDFVEARNGRHALDLLADLSPALIVTDINMPEMDGLTFLEHLREDPTLCATPCVVISTEGSREVIDRVLSLGAVGFIQKPFRPEELAPVIAPYLGMAVAAADEGGDF
ncbi:MAG: response regulator [Nitrospirae bacterium]|nr:MAG: response regulator [Nitrospirota bacterium]